MQKTRLTLLILIVGVLLSCDTRLTSPPKQLILLYKDYDGLYLYNPLTEKENIIFKASNKQVFLDEPYLLSNDTLTFGIAGELVSTETSSYNSGSVRYNNDFYSVDLKTGRNWLSRKIFYEVFKHSTIHIKTQLFDINGKTTILSDSSMAFHSSSTTSKGTIYNNTKPRFFSKHTLVDNSVFSYRGSIYYTHNSDTTILVKYNRNYDPKFGSGYLQPQIDPTGQYAVFRYLPGVMNFTEDASLQKVNIQTKKTKVIKSGDFIEPTFSMDGKFILFRRNVKEGKANTRISKIYLLDLTTLKEHEIGDAISAQWIK